MIPDTREHYMLIPAAPGIPWIEIAIGCALVCAMVFIGGWYA